MLPLEEANAVGSRGKGFDPWFHHLNWLDEGHRRQKCLEVEWNFQSWSFWNWRTGKGAGRGLIELAKSSLVSKGFACVWTGAKGVHLCPVSLSSVARNWRNPQVCRKGSGRNLFAFIYHHRCHRLYKAETGSLKDVFRYLLIHLMNRSTKIGELYRLYRWIRMRSRRIRTNRFGNWRRFAPVGFPTLQFLGAWMRIAKTITVLVIQIYM